MSPMGVSVFLCLLGSLVDGETILRKHRKTFAAVEISQSGTPSLQSDVDGPGQDEDDEETATVRPVQVASRSQPPADGPKLDADAANGRDQDEDTTETKAAGAGPVASAPQPAADGADDSEQAADGSEQAVPAAQRVAGSSEQDEDDAATTAVGTRQVADGSRSRVLRKDPKPSAAFEISPSGSASLQPDIDGSEQDEDDAASTAVGSGQVAHGSRPRVLQKDPKPSAALPRSLVNGGSIIRKEPKQSAAVEISQSGTPSLQSDVDGPGQDENDEETATVRPVQVASRPQPPADGPKLDADDANGRDQDEDTTETKAADAGPVASAPQPAAEGADDSEQAADGPEQAMFGDGPSLLDAENLNDGEGDDDGEDGEDN